MRPNNQLFEQLSQTLNRVLPRELTDDVRENLKAGIADVLDRFDLVTREELEVQEAVLRRTREKLEALEAQVAELEKRLQERPPTRSTPAGSTSQEDDKGSNTTD